MSFFSPLEQFSIDNFFCYEIRILLLLNLISLFIVIKFNFPVKDWFFYFIGFFFIVPTTSLNYMAWFIGIIQVIVLSQIVSNLFVVSKFQKIFLFLFSFIADILEDTISVKKYSFIIVMYLTFLFICFSNVFGMFPFSITITSHLIITIYFSLAFFIANILVGICYHKEKFFSLFLPEGVPVWIIPALILIEFVSYISRIFSLSIRLFANMLAGHILLKILVSFIFAMVSTSFDTWFLNLFSVSIIFVIILLEIGIACLQAYVFTVLSIVYLKDIIHMH
jgi:ATP synthase subunit 6